MRGSGIRVSETAYTEWGGEPRRNESGALYKLLTAGDAACADDPVRNRWVDDNRDAPTAMRAICARCPISEPCLDYALLNDVDGIWGGTTEGERRKMRGAIKPEPLRERWSRI